MDKYLIVGLMFLVLISNTHPASTPCGTCDILFHHLPDFDGKKVSDFPLTTYHGLEFVWDCTRRCWDNNICRSYMFNSETGQCSTFAVGYSYMNSTFTPVRTDTGAKLYTACGRTNNFGSTCFTDLDCHYTNAMCNIQRCICIKGYTFVPSIGDCMIGPNAFDSQCSTDEDCDYINAKCSKSTCGCDVGYIFDFHTGNCVIRCIEYGNFGIVMPKRTIAGQNKVQLSSISLAECMDRCKNETSFICVNVDFYIPSGFCCLQNASWHDFDVDLHTSGLINWEFHQRNCDF